VEEAHGGRGRGRRHTGARSRHDEAVLLCHDRCNHLAELGQLVLELGEFCVRFRLGGGGCLLLRRQGCLQNLLDWGGAAGCLAKQLELRVSVGDDKLRAELGKVGKGRHVPEPVVLVLVLGHVVKLEGLVVVRQRRPNAAHVALREHPADEAEEAEPDLHTEEIARRHRKVGLVHDEGLLCDGPLRLHRGGRHARLCGVPRGSLCPVPCEGATVVAEKFVLPSSEIISMKSNGFSTL